MTATAPVAAPRNPHLRVGEVHVEHGNGGDDVVRKEGSGVGVHVIEVPARVAASR